jgi:hypothetical protein
MKALSGSSSPYSSTLFIFSPPFFCSCTSSSALPSSQNHRHYSSPKLSDSNVVVSAYLIVSSPEIVLQIQVSQLTLRPGRTWKCSSKGSKIACQDLRWIPTTCNVLQNLFVNREVTAPGGTLHLVDTHRCWESPSFPGTNINGTGQGLGQCWNTLHHRALIDRANLMSSNFSWMICYHQWCT